MSNTSQPKLLAGGNLEDRPIEQILIYIFEQKLSGSLRLDFEDKTRLGVYLHQGRPAVASWSPKRFPLEELLVDLDFVDSDEVSIVREDSNANVVETFRQKGIIDDDAYAQTVREQIRRSILAAFEHEHGRYAFYEQINLIADAEVSKGFPTDVLPIVTQGLRLRGAGPIGRKILAKLSGQSVRISDPSALASLGLEAGERRASKLLLGPEQDFDRLLQDHAGKRSELETVIYLMLLLKALEMAPREAAPQPQHRSSPANAIATPVTQHRSSPANAIATPVTQHRSSPANAIATPVTQHRSSPAGAVATPARDEPSPPDAKPHPQKNAPAASSILKHVADLESALEKGDYFELLGVPHGASPEEARAAFMTLAKELHPDRVGKKLEEDDRKRLATVFSALTQAHTALTHPKMRKEYLASLSEPAPEEQDEEQIKVRSALEAESSYQKALVFLRRSETPKAVEMLTRTLELAPEEPEYIACWAHAQSLQRGPGARVDDLLAQLRRAAEKTPKSVRVQAYLAQMLKRADRLNEAAAQFEKVLQQSPSNIEAARELRLLKMRLKKDAEKSKGFFGKLFK